MSKKTNFACTVLSCKRIQSSVNGNPRYEIMTDRGPIKTARDTAAAYNLESDFPTGETLNIPTVFKLDNGEIIDWEQKRLQK